MTFVATAPAPLIAIPAMPAMASAADAAAERALIVASSLAVIEMPPTVALAKVAAFAM